MRRASLTPYIQNISLQNDSGQPRQIYCQIDFSELGVFGKFFPLDEFRLKISELLISGNSQAPMGDLRSLEGMRWPDCSRGKMEVHIVAGGYWRAIQRGGLVMPAAKSGFDLFIDAMTDCLHDLGFDHIALGIDRNFNNNVAHQISRKFGAIDRRIGVDGWIRDVDLMSGDRAIDQGSQRRSGMRVVIALLRVGNDLLGFGRGCWFRL